MSARDFFGVALAALLGLTPAVRTQDARPGAAAATVNGEPIPEVAVQRGLKRVPPEKQAEARAEILDYLISNLLVDQYLIQLKVDVPRQEVDTRLQQIRDDIKRSGQTAAKVMGELGLTEDELRAQITAEMRWEKYLDKQATDPVLQEVYSKNPEMFDGTTVRARHILLSPADEQNKGRLAALRKEIEDDAARRLAALPTDAEREKARAAALDAAFVAAAEKHSACPSKKEGGDLGWFARIGNMVEPFAAAAFALKPGQMSDVVTTKFGQHLILVTDRRPGKETKFEDVKDVVKDVYGERLRDYFCTQLRPRSRIVVTPATKP